MSKDLEDGIGRANDNNEDRLQPYDSRQLDGFENIDEDVEPQGDSDEPVEGLVEDDPDNFIKRSRSHRLDKMK